MSGTLKKITAPTLGTGYGKNIKETFDNIDSNFGIIGNSELYRGADGRSLISAAIPMGTLMSASNFDFPFNGITYKVTSQRSSIISAINTLSTGTDDRNAFIGQLSSSTETVMCCLSYPENEVSVLDVLSITPYIVLDGRFQNIHDDGHSLNGLTDMSCVFTVNAANTWGVNQPFPTLHYNAGSGENDRNAGMYWTIHGSDTLINARGPKGQDGESGKVYVCTITAAQDSTYGGIGGDASIHNILNPSGNFEDITTTHMNIAEGSTAFIIPENQTGNDQDNFNYYISVLRNDGGTWKVNIGPSNACYVYLGAMAFKQVMMKIDANDPSAVIKGIFCPLPEVTPGTKTGFMIFADSNLNSLNIVGVENLESQYLTDESRFSYNFKADVRIYDTNKYPDSGKTADISKIQTYKFDSLREDPSDSLLGLLNSDVYKIFLIDSSVPGTYDDNGDPTEFRDRGYYWVGEPYFAPSVGDLDQDQPHSTTGWGDISDVPAGFEKVFAFSKVQFPTDNDIVYLCLNYSERDSVMKYDRTYEVLTDDQQDPAVLNLTAHRCDTDGSLPNNVLTFDVWGAKVRIGVDGHTNDAYLKRPINIVAGEVTISDHLTVGSDLSVGKSLSVSGDTSIGGGLEVNGQINTQSSANIKGKINVGSDSVFDGDLTVNGQNLNAKAIKLTGNKDSVSIIAPTLTVKDSGVNIPTNVTMGVPDSSHIINGATTFKNKVTISTVANGSGQANFVRLSMGSVFNLIGKTLEGKDGTIGKLQDQSQVYKWRARQANKNAVIKKSKCVIAPDDPTVDIVTLPSGADIDGATGSTASAVSNPFTGLIKVKNTINYNVVNKGITALGISRNQSQAGPMKLPVTYSNTDYFEPLRATSITADGRNNKKDNEETKYSFSIGFDMGQIKLGDLKMSGGDADTGAHSLYGFDWDPNTNQVKLNMNVYQPIIDAVIKTGQDNGGHGKLSVNIDYYVIQFQDPSSNYSHAWKSSVWSTGTYDTPTMAISNWVYNPVSPGTNTNSYNKKTIYSKFVSNGYQPSSSDLGSEDWMLYQHCSELKDWEIPANSDGSDSYRRITLYGKQPVTNVYAKVNVPSASVNTFNKIRIQAFMIVTFRITGGHKNFWGRIGRKDYCDIKKNLSYIGIWDIRSSYNGTNDQHTLNKTSGSVVHHGSDGLNGSRLKNMEALYFNPDTIYSNQNKSVAAGVRYKGDIVSTGTYKDNLSVAPPVGFNMAPFITFEMYDLVNAKSVVRRQRLYICPDGIIMSGGGGQYFYLIQKQDPNASDRVDLAIGYTRKDLRTSNRYFVDLLDRTHDQETSIQWNTNAKSYI